VNRLVQARAVLAGLDRQIRLHAPPLLAVEWKAKLDEAEEFLSEELRAREERVELRPSQTRVGQARAIAAAMAKEVSHRPESEDLADRLDSLIAHLDLELEDREKGGTHDGTLPEWREGWPRGTWLDSFGFVFEVTMTAHDNEGSLIYLVPASYFGLAAAPTRWITIYAATVGEARLRDGRIFRRII
jgi:hypothetical protein